MRVSVLGLFLASLAVAGPVSAKKPAPADDKKEEGKKEEKKEGNKDAGHGEKKPEGKPGEAAAAADPAEMPEMHLASETKTVKAGTITFDVPADWKVQEGPPARFVVPKNKKDTTACVLRVYSFSPSLGDAAKHLQFVRGSLEAGAAQPVESERAIEGGAVATFSGVGVYRNRDLLDASKARLQWNTELRAAIVTPASGDVVIIDMPCGVPTAKATEKEWEALVASIANAGAAAGDIDVTMNVPVKPLPKRGPDAGVPPEVLAKYQALLYPQPKIDPYAPVPTPIPTPVGPSEPLPGDVSLDEEPVAPDLLAMAEAPKLRASDQSPDAPDVEVPPVPDAPLPAFMITGPPSTAEVAVAEAPPLQTNAPANGPPATETPAVTTGTGPLEPAKDKGASPAPTPTPAGTGLSEDTSPPLIEDLPSFALAPREEAPEDNPAVVATIDNLVKDDYFARLTELQKAAAKARAEQQDWQNRNRKPFKFDKDTAWLSAGVGAVFIGGFYVVRGFSWGNKADAAAADCSAGGNPTASACSSVGDFRLKASNAFLFGGTMALSGLTITTVYGYRMRAAVVPRADNWTQPTVGLSVTGDF